MATAAVDLKRQQQPMTGMEQQAVSSGPPSYYMTAGPSNAVTFGPGGSDPMCGNFVSSQTPLLHAANQAPTVMVTQPVVMASAPPPDTTCAFVMSTISAIVCGFWCGAVGILLAWKARTQVLDKKYDHARHSLRIVWLFFFLACFFGLIVGAVVAFYLYVIVDISRRYRYYG